MMLPLLGTLLCLGLIFLVQYISPWFGLPFMPRDLINGGCALASKVHTAVRLPSL